MCIRDMSQIGRVIHRMGRSRKKLCSKSGQSTGKADSQSGKDSKKQMCIRDRFICMC